MKELIARSMKKKDSKLKLLLGTDSYGMGTDSPNIRRIVHVGVPATVESKNPKF